jgi:hypothetical protein
LLAEVREMKTQMRSLLGRSSQLFSALLLHRRRAKIVDSALASLKKLHAKVN